MVSCENSGTEISTVGLIGCGTMGMCMLTKLVDEGYSVFAYDKFPSAAKQAEEAGARVVASPKEVATACNVILMSLPGPVQIEQVVFGVNGLFDAVTDNHVVIDTSTVEPDTTKSVANRFNEKGAAYLDCPILGRPSAVGKWMLPSGGNLDALNYVRPVLMTFAGQVVHTGVSGSGDAIKLLNQILFSAINSITAEVLAIADKVGVGRKTFYETVAYSQAATVSGLFKEVGQKIIDEDYGHPTFTVDLLIKDAKLALQMAKNANAPSVLASAVQVYNEIASATGLGNEDTSALYKVYEKHYRKD